MLSNMLNTQLTTATPSLSIKIHHSLFSSHHCMFAKKKPYSSSSSRIICRKIERKPRSFGNTNKTLSGKEAPPSTSANSLSTTKPYFTTTADDDHGGDIDEVNVMKNELPGQLVRALMPKHVAVIMDGHGRWAKNRGLPTRVGHYIGFMVKLKEMILSCSSFGIRVFTVYSFSSENWARPKEEIDCLMSIFEDLIRSQIKELIYSDDLRFSVIGDKTRLPNSLQHAIFEAEETSKSNQGMHLVMAISYSGQNEITEAVKGIAQKIEDGSLRAEDISANVLERQLQISNTVELFPNVDLLIRTSGELRLSNFMLWQCAYAEFYFSDKLLPDFEEGDLVEALESFQLRKRRYGCRKN